MAPTPVPEAKLKEIAQHACDAALKSATAYDHASTESWNNSIINNILQSLIAETTPSGDAPAPYKFAVNSTLVQHSTPRPSSAGGEAAPVAASAGAHGGRRGMHSATGAYWNEERDGMWSFKWDGGEEKGMDVVVAVLWFSL